MLATFIEAAAAAGVAPPERRGRYCCVAGCHNNQGRDAGRGVRFHQFPTKNPERRERWNAAVNRSVPERPGELWRATNYDVICSEHFVGGKKCDKVDSDSYVPSIFPNVSIIKASARKGGNRKCVRDASLGSDAIKVESDAPRLATMTDVSAQVDFPPIEVGVSLNFCDNLSPTEKATLCRDV